MPVFLAADWITACDGALRGSAAVRALAPLVVEQIVTGVPGAGDVRYHVVLGGEPGFRSGAPGEPADLVLTTDYATAVALAHGTTNAQHALAAGRLKVGGDVQALVGRADALAALDDALAAVRAATSYP